MPNDAQLPSLIEALKEGGKEEIERAAAALAELPPEQTVPVLVGMLKKDSHVSAAAIALARLRERAAAAISALIDALKTERWFLDEGRYWPPAEPVCEALASTGLACVAPLVEALDSEMGTVRFRLTRALGRVAKCCPEAVPRLTEAVEDPDWHVRAEAVLALWRIGSHARAAQDVLRRALQDKNLIVRVRADYALAAIDPGYSRSFSNALELLTDALRDPSDGVSPSAGETIRELGAEALVCVPDLFKLLASNDTAASLLGELAKRDPAITDRLIELVNGSNPKERERAPLALSATGSVARAAVPHLIHQLRQCAEDPRQDRWDFLPLLFSMIELVGTDADEVGGIFAGLLRRNQREAETVCRDLMLLDRDPCRSWYAMALGRHKYTDPGVAVDALAGALRDPDWFVRDAAKRSLRRLLPADEFRALLAKHGPRRVCPVAHIYKRTKTERMLAALAMVSGVPYEAVAARRPNLGESHLPRVLEELTGRPWQWTPFPRRTHTIRTVVENGLAADWPALVLIPGSWWWQKSDAVVVFGPVVHDPQFPLSYLTDNNLWGRQWVSGIIKPAENGS